MNSKQSTYSYFVLPRLDLVKINGGSEVYVDGRLVAGVVAVQVDQAYGTTAAKVTLTLAVGDIVHREELSKKADPDSLKGPQITTSFGRITERDLLTEARKLWNIHKRQTP